VNPFIGVHSLFRFHAFSIRLPALGAPYNSYKAAKT
jgi:hypothetical protein